MASFYAFPVIFIDTVTFKKGLDIIVIVIAIITFLFGKINVLLLLLCLCTAVATGWVCLIDRSATTTLWTTRRVG